MYLDIGDVYEALAYYHNNPEEMGQIEKPQRRASKKAEARSTLLPPEN